MSEVALVAGCAVSLLVPGALLLLAINAALGAGQPDQQSRDEQSQRLGPVAENAEFDHFHADGDRL